MWCSKRKKWSRLKLSWVRLLQGLLSQELLPHRTVKFPSVQMDFCACPSLQGSRTQAPRQPGKITEEALEVQQVPCTSPAHSAKAERKCKRDVCQNNLNQQNCAYLTDCLACYYSTGWSGVLAPVEYQHCDGHPHSAAQLANCARVWHAAT